MMNLEFMYKMKILIILIINEIMMANDLCLSCGLEVIEDNEASVCAVCDNLQHRLCGTGLSVEEYLEALITPDYEYICGPCQASL